MNAIQNIKIELFMNAVIVFIFILIHIIVIMLLYDALIIIWDYTM